MPAHGRFPIGQTLGWAAMLLLTAAQGLPAQVPSKIPSDPEAQIFNLIKRVTELEEKLAALTNGTAALRVRAPFVVTDAGGNPVLQVTGNEAPLGKEGVIIGRDSKADIGAIRLYNAAGEDIVNVVQLAGKGGAVLLSDDKSVERVALSGDGRLALADEGGKDVIALGDDISKDDATIRIGGDDGGYAVQVDPGEGGGMAALGTDKEGVAVLALSDDQDRERAILDGEGRLEISDDTDREILTVSKEGYEKDAGVAITLTDGGGQIRVTDKSGKTAAGIIGAKHAVVVTNPIGKVVAEMLATETSEGLFQSWAEGAKPVAVLGRGPGKGGVLQISNGSTAVATLMAGESGAGRLQLSDVGGGTVVEAGTLTSGQGVVRVGPRYRCGSNTGLAAAALGPVANAALPPDCIVGLK